MKAQITTLFLLASLSFSSFISAQEITLPVISRPEILMEGTQKELSAAQIAELLPWANDSKLFLKDLLESTQGISTTDKIDRLVAGIQSVVIESNKKNSELFMRYILNRALVLNEILEKEADSSLVGSTDAQVRVLLMSVNMAIKYYDVDLQVLSKKTVAPFKQFGLEYFNFLNDLNKSIFDASAQYSIQRTALEWLQWDLYRDVSNTRFAPQIFKINNNLKIFPKKPANDAQSISYIRRMKQVTANMDFGDGAVIKGSTGSTAVIETNANTAEEDASLRDVKISVGDRFNYQSYSGKVLEVFSNGQARVTYDYHGGIYLIPISGMGKALRCVKKFCKGDRVTSETYTGEILEVYSNKKVKMSYDGHNGTYFVSFVKLGKGINGTSCGLAVCANNRFMYQNYTGNVLEVFDNGKAKVTYDGHGGTYLINISEMSVSR